MKKSGMKNKWPYLLLLSILIIAHTACKIEEEKTVRPNVILIMADDLGYETINANGGTSYQTPAIDQMAAEGMRFEHCYAQPLCTPSRVKIMTGLYNVRNYVRFGLLDTTGVCPTNVCAFPLRQTSFESQ